VRGLLPQPTLPRRSVRVSQAQHYGNPAAGLHTLQLEINRALYMNERKRERTAGFARLAADLETLADRLGDIPLAEIRPYRAAAE